MTENELVCILFIECSLIICYNIFSCQHQKIDLWDKSVWSDLDLPKDDGEKQEIGWIVAKHLYIYIYIYIYKCVATIQPISCFYNI